LEKNLRIDELLLWLLMGKRWRRKTWASNRDMERIESLIRISSATILSQQFNLNPRPLDLNDKGDALNPSIVEHGGRYFVSYRRTNVLTLNDGNCIIQDPENIARSLVGLLVYDKSFGKLDEFFMDTSRVSSEGLGDFCGLEDARLFVWRGELHCIAAGVFRDRRGQNVVRQIMGKIDGHLLSDP